MPVVWRFLYSVADSEAIVRLVAALLRLLARGTGRPLDEGLVAQFERRYVLSGWPHHTRGWINLDLSRFAWRVRQRLVPRCAVAQIAPRNGTPARLRVGLVGRFSGLLGFPAALIAACPEDVDAFIFDIEFNGRLATNLRSLVAGYETASPSRGMSAIGGLAEAINRTELDMLLNVEWKRDVWPLLDLVATPCIAHYNSGSDLLHHPKVDVQLLWQFEADYALQGTRLFCGTTERPSPFTRIRQIHGFYDRRDLDEGGPPPWIAREPLIVYHGSLYKLDNREYLNTVFALLREDRALQFVFMGKDNGAALASIAAAAAAAGVSAQTHYDGEFNSLRGADGALDDAGWARMKGHLRRARLAPNPWPLGGGSSRFEAYVAGIPTAHIGLRTSRESWRRPQPTICDLPQLHVPAGTVQTIDDYRVLCARCLYDERFATELVAAQTAVAATASDARAWWNELRTVHEEWRSGAF